MPYEKRKAQWKARKRERLMKMQGGRCYYCRCEMTILPPTHKGRLPDDAATFEHLDDRYSPERGRHYGEIRVVLACNKCNFERNREREKEVGIETLRASSINGLLRKYTQGSLQPAETQRLTDMLNRSKKLT